MILDGLDRDDGVSALGTRWQAISDRVMGGISRASLDVEVVSGRRCLRLTGDVRLENNGGFVQMALDLAPHGRTMDGGRCNGVRLVVLGNGERYAVHLRTADLLRPWESYRAAFDAPPRWQEVRLPFGEFAPHRTRRPLDLSRLRRIGIVAIGRAFHADIALAELAFYD